MKVLMFGWEFPPIISGGLGVACHGIVQGLIDQHIDIALVLPFSPGENSLQEKRLQYIDALQQDGQRGAIDIKLIDALIQPYWLPEQYMHHRKNANSSLYGENLWSEVQRYAHEASAVARGVSHDVIHVHDWLTVLAANR